MCDTPDGVRPARVLCDAAHVRGDVRRGHRCRPLCDQAVRRRCCRLRRGGVRPLLRSPGEWAPPRGVGRIDAEAPHDGRARGPSRDLGRLAPDRVGLDRGLRHRHRAIGGPRAAPRRRGCGGLRRRRIAGFHPAAPRRGARIQHGLGDARLGGGGACPLRPATPIRPGLPRPGLGCAGPCGDIRVHRRGHRRRACLGASRSNRPWLRATPRGVVAPGRVPGPAGHARARLAADRRSDLLVARFGSFLGGWPRQRSLDRGRSISPPYLVRHVLRLGGFAILAAVGVALASSTRRWAIVVGLAAATLGVAGFLVFLAARGTFVSPRYVIPVDLGILFAAGLGFGALRAPAFSRLRELGDRRIPGTPRWMRWGSAGAIAIGIGTAAALWVPLGTRSGPTRRRSARSGIKPSARTVPSRSSRQALANVAGGVGESRPVEGARAARGR